MGLALSEKALGPRWLYEFFPSAITMYHKRGGLKQQKLILSWFQRPEVQDQGVGRAMGHLNGLGKNPTLLLPGF